MTEWRYRCPEGHCSWRPKASGDYYCKQCGEVFQELEDAKTGRRRVAP